MENLHQLFVQLGRKRNALTNEMLVILPRIFESGVWKKYADSIVEYAGKYGGLPKTTVRKRLGLDLSQKPMLEAAIKDVGVHKIAIINSVTTVENQEEMVKKAKALSKPALKTFVKDLKGQKHVDLSVDLDEEAEFMFRKLQKKLGGNSNKEAMKRALKKLFDLEFPPVRPQKAKKGQKMTVTRYVPSDIKRQALAKTAGRCAKCPKPAEELHHRVPFSIKKSHESIVPLCREHHEIEHCEDELYLRRKRT